MSPFFPKLHDVAEATMKGGEKSGKRLMSLKSFLPGLFVLVTV